jgi:hypothetical protein
MSQELWITDNYWSVWDIPVSNQRGTTRRQWFIAIGYIGPSNTPTTQTATASPIRDGTNHMINSKLPEVDVSVMIERACFHY